MPRTGNFAACLALLTVAACGGPWPAEPVASRSSVAGKVVVVGVTNWRSGTLDQAVCLQLGNGGLDVLLHGPSRLQVRVAVRAGKLFTVMAKDDLSHTELLVRDTTDGTLTFTDQEVTLEGLIIKDGEHVVKLDGSVRCRPP
jgi:hypothetical protein